jgi:hypothetical protein
MAREKRIPYIRFYTTDWRGDVPLRMCSFAARGLWIDLLTLMHESDRPGLLLIAGQAPSARQLAALLGGGEKEIAKLLNELESAGIFSRDAETGAILSRRMVRDREKAEIDRENGRSGGNPNLKAPDKPGGGGPDNRGVNPKAKAHGFTISSSSKSLSSSTSAPGSASAGPAATGDDAAAIIGQFDESRSAAFGPEQARAYPAGTDHVIATRLIDRGATPAFCRPIFDAVNAKLKAKGLKPRDRLSAMEGDVVSALEAKAKPAARANGADPATTRLVSMDERFVQDVILRVVQKRSGKDGLALRNAYVADPVAGLAEARRIDEELRAEARGAA